MSSTIIRNIIHKYIDQPINILYEPTYSLLDDMVFSLPYNFYLTKPYASNRDNVLCVTDISLFSYDLFFNYGANVSDMGYKLHIPTLQYIPSFTADTIDIGPNVLYVVEGSTESNQNSLHSVDIPTTQNILDTTKIYDSVLLDTGLSKLDPKIISFFKERIPALHIINEPRDLANIAKYKIVIDLYPSDMTNLVFALQHKTVYISTPKANTTQYAKIYNNILLGAMILDVVAHHDNILKTYTDNMFSNDIGNIPDSKWSEQMRQSIQQLKHTGFYSS